LAGSKSFGAAVYKILSPICDIVEVSAPSTDDPLWKAAAGHCSTNVKINQNSLEASEVDLIVSAHNYEFISPAARNAARFGAIGYHPSLLPRHRGRYSIEWTIRSRDPIAGGSVYRMDDGWDTGPVILQDFCHVAPDWTPSDLWRKCLFGMGVELLARAVEIGPHAWMLQSQDEQFATMEFNRPDSLMV
jgi:methionyl-tRNA formyltransferase